MTTILIVDDEQQMRSLIQVMLTSANLETVEAQDAIEAQQILAQQQIDLVLLDVMMPGVDGFTLCTTIRQLSNVPIIFLTARDANDDKVKGLKLGADDYIVKPFSASELAARIEAVLRRAGQTVVTDKKMLVRGYIQLDEIARKVMIEQQLVSLTLKEYELLHLFMQSPNTVFSREQLLELVWHQDYEGGTRTVDTHIKTLRLKLSKIKKEASESICTVWGVGYRFELKS
ncbi:MAG: response regulator transcription factor [Lysinibacillus sp.]